MKVVLLVLLTFLVYSSSGIFSKLASQYSFLSLEYLISLTAVVAVLGVYAVLWQKILGILPLNRAFLCKSITIPFGLVFSSFLFSEVITMQNVIGTSFIVAGLVVLTFKN